MSKRLFVLMCSILLVVPLLFIGCSGDDGATGAQGPPGNDGADYTLGNGEDFVSPTNDIPAQPNKDLVITGLLFGVDGTDNVTATFSLSDGTNPVTGLAPARTTLYMAGLIPGTSGDSDEWDYWDNVAVTSLVEGPAGTYLLTSNQLSTAAPAGSTKQRGIVRITGLTGYNPINQGYDFDVATPGTPVARGKDVVSDAACKECHGFGVTIHSYGRNDTKTCVVCHSPNYNGTIASHGADMVTMVHQIHTNKADVLGGIHFDGHGENWVNLAYPGDILNCAKCHKDVVEADNWKNRPTQTACKSCHTGIKFDGTPSTAIDNVDRTFTHFATNNNAGCAGCHGASSIADGHKPASSHDAAQRTLTASITGVTIDPGDGGVTVTFSVADGGVPVTDNTQFQSLSFTLAKLVPSANGVSSYWQSYLSKVRTKDAAKPPVIQGRNEAYPGDGGTLAHLGGGVYTYKFALLNADTPGDIRTITHAHNNSTVAGQYNQATLPTLLYPVAYDNTLTHRVAISLAKVADNSDIKWNAFYDWVPAGNSAETRNIVSRDACNNCHGDNKLHAGYSLEYCVGCHNKNSYDPFSGSGTPALTTSDTAPAGSSSVELVRVVHKIHMGKNLPSVKAGGSYVINGTHDYSKLEYPSGAEWSGSTPNPSNCTVCHDEGNTDMTESANWRTKPTSAACGTCHDASAHIAQNALGGDSCTLCHSVNADKPVKESHGIK